MAEIRFPNDWVKMGDNVQNADVIQFIDAGHQEEDGRWTFTVAIFRNGELIEAEKKFGLNKTNAKAIIALYGSNSDNWVNKEMTVNSIKVRNPQTNSLVDSIALSAPAVPTPEAPVTTGE